MRSSCAANSHEVRIVPHYRAGSCQHRADGRHRGRQDGCREAAEGLRDGCPGDRRPVQDRLWVFHAFRRKSKTGIKTPKAEVDLIGSRLAQPRRKMMPSYPDAFSGKQPWWHSEPHGKGQDQGVGMLPEPAVIRSLAPDLKLSQFHGNTPFVAIETALAGNAADMIKLRYPWPAPGKG